MRNCKALLCILCSCLLALTLVLSSAQAAGSVYFTAAGSYVLPLSDSTMPFWTGGYLYIPTTIFTGSSREALGISQVLNNDRVVLYSGGRSLTFELGNGCALDNDGIMYYPGAVRRNGVFFVPAYAVSCCFGVVYSVIDVDRGSLVWIRQPDYGLSDSLYADAAHHTMESVYAEYLRAKEQASQAPVVQPEPEKQPAQPAEQPSTELDGKRVYLCLGAGEDTSALLDVLDFYGVQVAVFFTPAQMEQSGDLLRRMTAGGHQVGLLADGGDPNFTLEDQLEAGNQALSRATCGKTRLALIQNGGEAPVGMGLRCLRPDLDRSSQPLRNAAGAETLLQRISSYRGDAAVWLGNAVSSAGLRAFLSAVKEAGGVCTALTETAGVW